MPKAPTTPTPGIVTRNRAVAAYRGQFGATTPPQSCPQVEAFGVRRLGIPRVLWIGPRGSTGYPVAARRTALGGPLVHTAGERKSLLRHLARGGGPGFLVALGVVVLHVIPERSRTYTLQMTC